MNESDQEFPKEDTPIEYTSSEKTPKLTNTTPDNYGIQGEISVDDPFKEEKTSVDEQRFAPPSEMEQQPDRYTPPREEIKYPLAKADYFDTPGGDRFAPPNTDNLSSVTNPEDRTARSMRRNTRGTKNFIPDADNDRFSISPSPTPWWTAGKPPETPQKSAESTPIPPHLPSSKLNMPPEYSPEVKKSAPFAQPTIPSEDPLFTAEEENYIHDKKSYTKLRKGIKVDSTAAYAEATHKSFFHFISYNIRNARLSTSLLAKVILINLSVIILVYLGLIWNWKTNVDQSFQTVDALSLNAGSIRNRPAQAGDQTFLIVGVDSRSGANAELGGGNSEEISGARSDTIILVDIPANRKRVVAVSIPRDLQVDRPDCKQWDNNSGTYSSDIVPGEQDSKINAAYAYGGPKCLVTIVQNLSGIEINHFVAMDFIGFVRLVDDVGGVEVCNTIPLVDDELGTILPHPGKHLISGDTALKYVRARMVDAENDGDYGRIRRQQHFISSLLRSMLSTRVLSNPAKLNALIRDFTEVAYVQNITTSTLLDLAQSIKDINAGHVTMLTVPTLGTSTDGKNNEIPNVPAMDTIFDDIIDDVPLPGEPGYDATINNDNSHASNTSDSAWKSNTHQPDRIMRNYTFLTPGPDTTPIHLINDGNSIVQLQIIASALNSLGYNSTDLVDGDRTLEHTIVQYALGERDVAAEIASLFPDASLQANPQVAGRIDILVGKDATNLPNNLPATGTQLSVHQIPSVLNRLPSNISYTNGADPSCID